MMAVELCLEQGVPYQEYIEQPEWFKAVHLIRFLAERKAAEKLGKKQKHG